MPDMMVDLQEQFLRYLKFEKRVSEHTLLAYKNDLMQFFDYFNEQYKTDDITAVKHIHIRSWLVKCKEANNKERSLQRKISSLKSFYKFLLKRNEVLENPTENIIAPKAPKRLPTFIEPQQSEKLFSEAQYPEGFEGMTHQLILELLYQTGIRRAELIGLKEADVDLYRNQIVVLGKRNKERAIPISEAMKTMILDYKKEKKLLFENDTKYLLTLISGKQLYDNYVYRVVKNYLSKVTTLAKKSPHVMRHSFATHLSNNGAEINAIKELLGHSSLAATQIYTHTNIEQLKKIYQKAHPKAVEDE